MGDSCLGLPRAGAGRRCKLLFDHGGKQRDNFSTGRVPTRLQYGILLGSDGLAESGMDLPPALIVSSHLIQADIYVEEIVSDTSSRILGPWVQGTSHGAVVTDSTRCDKQPV
jgi:hypothetical protein